MPRAVKAVEIPPIEFSEGEESEDEFALPPDFEAVDPDPKPSRSGRAARSSETKARVTIAVRKQVTKELAGFAEMLAEVWEMRDPYCGGVAVDQAAGIAEAWSDWVCEHPAWVAAITDAGQSAKLFKAAYKTMPLLTAIYAHHVSHSVQLHGESEVDYAAYAPVPDA